MKRRRPSQDEYFMKLAYFAGSRSNCLSRQVGCILVDSSNRVLSTGYNGVPRGMPHCDSGGCPRLGAKSGEDLHKCLAIHAEMNALMFCRNIDEIHKAYISASPCLTCMVMLLNTACQEIIFGEIYDEKVLEIWEGSGRKWSLSDAPIPYGI